MYRTIENLDEFNKVLKEHTGVLIYYSNETCNVCKVLKPQIIEMLKAEYPKIPFYYVDTNLTPDIAAQSRVFTIPTIIVFFDGNETIRKSRHIGLGELAKAIERPYNLIFDE
jgi:thioredoxin-like negative regulator of GroEL